MRKILSIALVAASAVAVSSCSSVWHSSTATPVETIVCSHATADLVVGQQKISYRYNPPKSVKRCGEHAVIETAVSEALRQYGNGDVLVAPEFEIKKTRGLFGSSIKYVIVEGYPAKYMNIKSVNHVQQ